MKLKTIIEPDLFGRRWFWKIENKKITIYGEKGCSTEKEAEREAAAFMNRCLTDRSTWGEFK